MLLYVMKNKNCGNCKYFVKRYKMQTHITKHRSRPAVAGGLLAREEEFK